MKSAARFLAAARASAWLPPVLLMAGCAAPTARIAAVEPPDGTYLDLDCQAVLVERGRIVTRLEQLGARVDAEATGRQAALGAGVVFWPALFAVDADNEARLAYAREKGLYERLAWQWRRRDCERRPMAEERSKPPAAAVTRVSDGVG